MNVKATYFGAAQLLPKIGSSLKPNNVGLHSQVKLTLKVFKSITTLCDL